MNPLLQSTRALLLCLLILPLASCAESKATVPVSAINFTEQELGSFVFQDPEDPKRVAGGPGLRPYESGGTMCCYSLPKKWRPGIKVKLVYYWWKGSESDPRTTQIIEIPRYPAKEPGMLWAIFNADGSVEAVSSDYDPGHAKWPGKVKHWPVPSLAYKRKLWEEEVGRLRTAAADYERVIRAPAPEDIADSWRVDSEYHKEKLSGFSGPNDPNYRKEVIRQYSDSLELIRRDIAELEKRKP